MHVKQTSVRLRIVIRRFAKCIDEFEAEDSIQQLAKCFTSSPETELDCAIRKNDSGIKVNKAELDSPYSDNTIPTYVW
jgi:hypothetical protein